MYYYEVLVGSQKYHGNEALTYASPDKLTRYSLVLVPLQRQAVSGFIRREVGKPSFPTKQILAAYDVPPLPAALPRLADWLRQYYPAPYGATIAQILPGNVLPKTVNETPGIDSPLPEHKPLPALTAEQRQALQTITKPDTYLLHGDTGTGKTRIYIELAIQALHQGKSAVILTPEIGLTSQLAASFQAVFGSRVIIVHSAMTAKARLQSWLKIAKASVPLIVIGPRSALFSPLPNIGLIVVDEAHEPAYKQEQAPHYQTVRVASQLAQLHQAILVLGSATPGIVDYYLAEQRSKPIIRLTQKAAGQSSQVTTVTVDLKDRTQFTRSPYISTKLLQSIDTSLRAGQQSLLYLNRRGTARVILCNNCGWQALCPRCDLPLTFHHDLYNLQCHSCGFIQPVPTACPQCCNADIIFKVVGTKAIEAEVRKLYPSARVMRFDTDNTKAERFEQHYKAVVSGEVDIIIGTQLLAKGLDLPLLSTLGVVIADTSLTFPDYTAEERTYQLLNQVIGRVGRGHVDTQGQPIPQRIIVQSYDPSRTVIQAALKNDWTSYYQTELAERQLFGFPPFNYLLKLTCRRASSKAAQKAAEQFMYTLSEAKLPLLIEGPMPSFHARVEDKFEWQLIIKSKQRSALLQVIALLKTDAKSGWSYDIDPSNLL